MALYKKEFSMIRIEFKPKLYPRYIHLKKKVDFKSKGSMGSDPEY